MLKQLRDKILFELTLPFSGVTREEVQQQSDSIQLMFLEKFEELSKSKDPNESRFALGEIEKIKNDRLKRAKKKGS